MSTVMNKTFRLKCLDCDFKYDDIDSLSAAQETADTHINEETDSEHDELGYELINKSHTVELQEVYLIKDKYR